jgi:superfamily II DNA or RNA helicase
VFRYSQIDLKFTHGIDSDCQVIVSTPMILLTLLRHAVIKISDIELIIFDECHHCIGNHPYAVIMNEFYHPSTVETRPRIFGMTASPLAQSSAILNETLESLSQLQKIMDCSIVTIKDKRQLDGYYAVAKEQVIEFDSSLRIQTSDNDPVKNYYEHYRKILDECYSKTFIASQEGDDHIAQDFLKSLKSLFGVIERRIQDLGYFGAVFYFI